MKSKRMKMEEIPFMGKERKLTKLQQEIYNEGFQKGLYRGSRDKVNEIKRILEIK